MKLIIAEKPSLGRTIADAIDGQQFTRRDGYLESQDYIVSWCFGHLYELRDFDKYFSDYDPEKRSPWVLSRLPFYPENMDFQYDVKSDAKTHKVDAGVKKQVNTLGALMNRKDVDTIYSAGDADREGEVIVRLVIDNGLKTKKPILRLWLPALTDEAINTALDTAKPDSEYENLYQAGKARAAIDWLIGIELTRYASIKAKQFIRIGRCVCPIVEQLVEREKAIKDFVPVPYLVISSSETTAGQEIQLTSKNTFKAEEKSEAANLAEKYNAAKASVKEVKTARKTIGAKKLFSMSDLQSFACKKDKTLAPSDVLASVQRLYESAYVTYPRTNSNYLAAGESSKVDGVIAALHRCGYSDIKNKPNSKAIYDDSKVESHSALMPTTKVPSNLSGTDAFIYECIRNRFLSVFCSEDCVVNHTTMVIACADEDFSISGDVQLTAGWRKYEPPTSGDKLLPALNKGDAVNVNFVPVEKLTSPPKRFTVETLNNWMKTPLRSAEKTSDDYSEEEWKDILSEATICTEATRADTIDRCVKSKYISLKKGTYYAEPAGYYLVDVLYSLGIDLGVAATVDLSRRLHEVKQGVTPYADALLATKGSLDAVFAQNGAIKSDIVVAGAKKGEVVGVCPKCGKSVCETPKAYSCEDRACGFALWKDDKFLLSIGKKMTISIAKAFLTKGSISLKKCTSKKSGKTFDCIVKADFSEKYPKYTMEFPKSKPKK